MKPLSHDFPFRASRNISALLLDILEEMFSSPYTVNFENGVDVQVQFVWTYELWNGLLRVDQTAYIEPGQTGVVRYARCIDLKQYAFSAWDVDGTAVYKSPTLTVQSINQVEAKWGFYRACTDKIKIAYRP